MTCRGKCRRGGKPAARAAAAGGGGSRGSAGTAMTWAQPDEVADHYPAGRCGCGADLAGMADRGVARSFQQLEVPLTTARRIQHDPHQARCGCGTVHVAAPGRGGQLGYCGLTREAYALDLRQRPELIRLMPAKEVNRPVSGVRCASGPARRGVAEFGGCPGAASSSRRLPMLTTSSVP
jgi:hypothetical protein